MNTTTTRTAGAAASAVGVLALVMLVFGGINWAMVGLFGVDLVATVFGVMSPLTRLVYVLVGLSALVVIGLFPRITRED